ncbi:hypothetical protein EVAR_12511_1 [Eumeta japonica]|uniref:Uncharacterized protein n=1 Tax=Eumeta variegata TaxID=151549 RepID=A0A4C1TPP3_EUMVA|nr:hypothetical protein EVAR_12511_1 [Eumeta japonica]
MEQKMEPRARTGSGIESETRIKIECEVGIRIPLAQSDSARLVAAAPLPRLVPKRRDFQNTTRRDSDTQFKGSGPSRIPSCRELWVSLEVCLLYIEWTSTKEANSATQPNSKMVYYYFGSWPCARAGRGRAATSHECQGDAGNRRVWAPPPTSPCTGYADIIF